MRCLALAQAGQDAGGHAVFLMASGAALLEERLRSEGMEVVPVLSQPGSVEDANQTARLAREAGASWVVVDGYHFGGNYQRCVKDAGLRLLFIDDNGHADHYYADIVLNQNLHAAETLYPKREHYTRLLLGTRYALLRREFLKWRRWKRDVSTVPCKVLVTLGGGDAENVTLKAIQALQQLMVDHLKVVVVVGGSNPHYEELQTAVQNLRVSVELRRHVTSMPELMAWADVAISAAGITSWELAFMGLPSLLLIQADNQSATVEGLTALGVAQSLGRSDHLSSDDIARHLRDVLETLEARAVMARRGPQIVDGDGVARVLMHLEGTGVRLRKALEEDCRLLWEWANDPEVRRVSFSSAAIPWEDHVRWFRSKLNNPDCILFIATNGGETPIGEIRYDLEGEEAVVSIIVDSKIRGKGYGSNLILLSARELFATTAITTIHAYVKCENEPSVRAFENAGFGPVSTTAIGGENAVHLTLTRSVKDAG
jgi:UDP-2,4-diacetamido-2,4,6-trideoxy-beta-L-altropyranose hydrolase